MSLASFIDRRVLGLDRLLAKIQVGVHERKGSLLTLFFHSLHADQAEVAQLRSDPQQATTVAHFREILGYFLEAGYRCVSPEDVLRGLDAKGRYFLVTFDDGYFNNHRALPVLEELKASATFFISTAHVLEGKAYWWDMLCRARHAAAQQGVAFPDNLGDLKMLTTDRAEKVLLDKFGDALRRSEGDNDRPFAPAELADFARHKRVSLGNHTHNHAILTNYSDEEIRREIARAQTELEQIAGVAPVAIAYPNGNYTPGIGRLAASCGLRLGFTTESRKDYLPATRDETRRMRLGRVCPYGSQALRPQCDHFRSDLALYEGYQQLKKSLKSMVGKGPA